MIPMPSTNERPLAAKHRLGDALLRLCRDRPIEQLSVTALCKEAGVARKTFYAHFNDIDELACELITASLLPIFESMPDATLENPARGDAIAHVVAGVTADRARIVELNNAFNSELILAVLHPIAMKLARRMLAMHGVDDEFLASYLSSSAAALALSALRTWMAREFSDSPDEVVRLMTSLLGPGTLALIESANDQQPADTEVPTR